MFLLPAPSLRPIQPSCRRASSIFAAIPTPFIVVPGTQPASPHHTTAPDRACSCSTRLCPRRIQPPHHVPLVCRHPHTSPHHAAAPSPYRACHRFAIIPGPMCVHTSRLQPVGSCLVPGLPARFMARSHLVTDPPHRSPASSRLHTLAPSSLTPSLPSSTCPTQPASVSHLVLTGVTVVILSILVLAGATIIILAPSSSSLEPWSSSSLHLHPRRSHHSLDHTSPWIESSEPQIG